MDSYIHMCAITFIPHTNMVYINVINATLVSCIYVRLIMMMTCKEINAWPSKVGRATTTSELFTHTYNYTLIERMKKQEFKTHLNIMRYKN